MNQANSVYILTAFVNIFTCIDFRRSIFSTTSHSNRNSRCGDNPGFTTDTEAGFGVGTLHRNSSQRSSLRPPSYHEAISGRLICMPGIAARISCQSPVTSPAARDSGQSPRATPTNSRRQQSQNASGVRTNGVDIRTSGAPVGACGGAPVNSRRFAYEYPSCFWEEEPPPPYSTISQYTPVTSVPVPVPVPSERPQPPARPQRVSAPLARYVKSEQAVIEHACHGLTLQLAAGLSV